MDAHRQNVRTRLLNFLEWLNKFAASMDAHRQNVRTGLLNFLE